MPEDVLDAAKLEAKKHGKKYQSLIQEILRDHFFGHNVFEERFETIEKRLKRMESKIRKVG